MKIMSKWYWLLSVFISINVMASNDAMEFKSIVESECKNHEWTMVYAVALTESGKYIGHGKVRAVPYAINSADGPMYFESKENAKVYMQELMVKYPGGNIDIGAMQLNVKWNKHRVENIEDLLDTKTNVKVACEVLDEAIGSSPDDIVIGIGRYHAWKDRERSIWYGNKVINIWKNLNNYIALQNK